eukprot:CAMPEP_0181036520 /NCGR_PEP_ID=MMETSP1070-20121207/8903_1 /TAXON_ID=265543 /ORGANISM="Minutocellus polymorphus, Strain NH13" /LENGTH=148 /DNA_ID=CAMNT_0023114157 /DNA_START=82 /DNA_END=528 /DNA_ORIENTATION=+
MPSQKLEGKDLRGEVLEDALAVDGLLCEESSGGEHGKAAVLELLRLHLEELLGVLGGEAEGVEAKVTGVVFGEELSGGVNGGLRGVDPSLLGAELLGGTDGGDEGDPELRGDLGDVADGGAGDGGIEEEGAALNLLANEETDGGEHGC